MQRVFRCYTQKRPGFDLEALALAAELRGSLGLSTLAEVRILNRYDVQGIDEALYASARVNVFSEPQCDDCLDEDFPSPAENERVLAVEALPGQYDQRADSCAQCIQILSAGPRPMVRAAKVYIFRAIGDAPLSGADMDKIRGHLINPVESREASLEKFDTLDTDYGQAADVEVLEGFRAMEGEGLAALHQRLGLAMDMDDLLFLQGYFVREEKREPTLTEIRLIDTYWSDHCRHTTFLTHIDEADVADAAVKAAFEQYLAARREVYGVKAAQRPVTLMDMATLGTKLLKRRGGLLNLDESEEINACSIRVEAEVAGQPEDWLVMFKNETHNHPTEIEPFGGAATCLGGAVRDPLSGRVYVYQAMRVTGAADPRSTPTMPGKLSQRRITRTAAAGYSSYGNQIGLATGLVHELYHPGYVAKRMEIGAVIGAAPAAQVRRERPAPGDLVILLGGRTGRDGMGGATGSSKAHTASSLQSCFAEVQKGNPPEERKIQRLFRDPRVTLLIKRCNDFGAGGVSVAIGELADGLDINLDNVPKKYEGLDGTELAISESQERMAVVVDASDAPAFIAYAAAENLEATAVAEVTDAARLRMRWRGKTIVDLSREFLSTNGAAKHARVRVAPLPPVKNTAPAAANYTERLKTLLSDINVCSQRGLGERFDGSIGAGSVFAPYGGAAGLAPAQVMAAKLPASGDTDAVTGMAFGGDPHVLSQNPFLGAQYALVSSVAKLVAAGFDRRAAYLSLQEYFPRLGSDPRRWGQPFAALLGAFAAQAGMQVAAIGGKDSMSGSYQELDVPPTLVSFAVAPGKAQNLTGTVFSGPGHPVYCFPAPRQADGSPDYPALLAVWDAFAALREQGRLLSARAVERGGAAEAIFKLAVGSDLGFAAISGAEKALFAAFDGAIVVETDKPLPADSPAVLIGHTTADGQFTLGGEAVSMAELTACWQAPLEEIFPTRVPQADEPAEAVTFTKRGTYFPAIKTARPLAVIPVFPGTNCEYDTARALERAGGAAEILVVRNLDAAALAQSVAAMEAALARAQMLIFPGGFSGGDEPDGSGKFIAAFFRNPRLTESVRALLARDGLILGVCNGFQALIKLGLVPYGDIRPMDASCPTLTFNRIGRHQARYVTTRVSSVLSPWLALCQPGQLHSVPISHGEGRFAASDEVLRDLTARGQIAFQYADAAGRPSMDISVNPNGSALAVEGITSPDGRVLGRMAHTERTGAHIGLNIPGDRYQPIFEAGVQYFK